MECMERAVWMQYGLWRWHGHAQQNMHGWMSRRVCWRYERDCAVSGGLCDELERVVVMLGRLWTWCVVWCLLMALMM